jgi:hypothetical protein
MQTKSQKARAAFGHGWKPPVQTPLFNPSQPLPISVPGGEKRRLCQKG